MKDLYRPLGLSPDASTREIKKRIQKADPDTENAVREILLNPDRRKVYDRCYQNLRMIGRLRQCLDLTDGPNWGQENAREFQPSDSFEEFTVGSPKQQEGILAKVFDFFGSRDTGVTGCLKSLFLRALLLALLFGACSLFSWMCESADEVATSGSDSGRIISEPSQQDELSSESETADRNTPRESDFDIKPKSLPSNGTWWDYTSKAKVAPLKVSVSSGRNYYIKLVDNGSDEPVLTLFIRDGQSARVDVPIGTYEMRYATGDTWYGPEHLFGPETDRYKAESKFFFYRDGGQVSGYSVELVIQEGGNLDTRRIPESEF